MRSMILSIDGLVFVGIRWEFADARVAGAAVLRLHAGAIEHGRSDHLPHAAPVGERGRSGFTRLSRGHGDCNHARGRGKKRCSHGSHPLHAGG